MAVCVRRPRGHEGGARGRRAFLSTDRSGRILRGTIKKIADGTEYEMPATIDDPAILDEIAESLKKAGYPGTTWHVGTMRYVGLTDAGLRGLLVSVGG